MDVTRSGGRRGGYYRFSRYRFCFDTGASKGDTNCGYRTVATIVEVVAIGNYNNCHKGSYGGWGQASARFICSEHVVYGLTCLAALAPAF